MRVPIGRALPNTTSYILDAHMKPVPVGVAGELYLGGLKVARGYIGRADLTAASFVSVPALPLAGRLYKTGDRVRWLQDGNVDFLGRVDFQVKLNGQRIEAGEIEAVLRQAEGVRDAVVVVQKTKAGVTRLVAYVVPGDVEAEGALEVCRSQLPAYMVPAVVVGLREWPLNSSGKVDRKQLPPPHAAAPTPARSTAGSFTSIVDGLPDM